MHRLQPSLYCQLDEIVYQGFDNDMHVPTLALDALCRSAKGSFLYVEELDYRKRSEQKLLMECDLNCVIDGLLTNRRSQDYRPLGPVSRSRG